MKRFAAPVLFTLLLCLPAPAQQVPKDPAVRLDSLFARYRERPSPGLALAVVRDGAVAYTGGWGMANLEHGVPITPSTVFDVASVSKQFTGLAVAMLVEEGKIRLEDDVRTYIPELPEFGTPITVDHLVHHTSGLRDWPGALQVAGWRFDDVISFEQILTMAYHQQDLNFEPGAEYTYSNTGYNLLAELVQRVTGTSFRAWTDAHLLGPLGMTSSHFQDDHTEVVPRRAYGYGAGPDGSFRRMTNNLTALGSSSLFSTVEDLAKWVLNFETATVGGTEAMALTRRRGVLNDGSTIPYAFGLSHGEYRGLPTVSHSGSWAQFTSYVVHFPEQRFGVVVLANGTVNAAGAAFAATDLFLADRLGPAEAASAAPAGAPAPVPAEVLDAYAGTYRLGPGWYLSVRRAGEELRVRATREDEVPAAARSTSEFWVAAYGAPLVFARDAGGTVTHLTYRGTTAPRMSGGPAVPALAPLVGTYESAELDTAWRIELEDGALLARHRRHGTVRLTHAWGDDFAGSSGLNAVTFERDASGGVTGFLVNAGPRNRNLRFVRTGG